VCEWLLNLIWPPPLSFYLAARDIAPTGFYRDRAKREQGSNGFRHSYASYRIRHLKGNLPELAQEMGNSPKEIINSYKRNVTDADADKWFNIMPPKDYAELIYKYIQNESCQFGFR
jgi:hypothetical protein